MSVAHSEMPPLLLLQIPAPGAHSVIILNANHIVSVSPSSATENNPYGSTVELATGRKVEISKSPDDFWEMI